MKILIWVVCIILANLVWTWVQTWVLAVLSPHMTEPESVLIPTIILFAILTGITIAVAHSLCQKYETYKGLKGLKKKRCAAAQEEPSHTETPFKTPAAYCPNCGKKLSDHRPFCGYCGAKVVMDSENEMSEM